MGNFDRAEQHYRYSLSLSREMGDELREKSDLGSLGVLFTNKGDYGQAQQVLDASLLIGQDDQYYWHSAVTHYQMGALMLQMGCLDSAHTALTNAVQQFSQRSNRHYEVKTRADLGLLYHLVGDQQRAQAEFTEGLRLIADYGDLRFEALVSTRLGYVLEENGQLDAARRRYELGYDLHNQMGQAYYALNALAGLARLAEQSGDHATALTYVQTIWETIAGKEMDATVETARTLRTCYEIFRQDDHLRADEVLTMACAQLRRRAGSIDEPEQLAQFWQLSDHCFFRDATAAGDLP
jgi:tetratricopeptide (TPR) repeat protein